MSGLPVRLVKGGIVVADPASATIRRTVVLQYNPASLTRSLQPRVVGEAGERVLPVRLTGPPVESIKLEAEIDAADQLELGDALVAGVGLHAHLAALETLVYPHSEALLKANLLASEGVLEIAPPQAPLVLFVWSRNRIVPVRITEFSIEEQEFSANLDPLRATVSLGFRVLDVNDLGFQHRGAAVYLVYQQTKERLATRAGSGVLGALGIGGVG